MIRTFVEVPLFTKRWKEIGLTDKELLALQIMLLTDAEKNALKKLVKALRDEAAKRR